MGFPKPWPTEWPEQEPYHPDEIPELEPDDIDKPEEPLFDEEDEEILFPIPEFRRHFYSVTWRSITPAIYIVPTVMMWYLTGGAT